MHSGIEAGGVVHVHAECEVVLGGQQVGKDQHNCDKKGGHCFHKNRVLKIAGCKNTKLQVFLRG